MGYTHSYTTTQALVPQLATGAVVHMGIDSEWVTEIDPQTSQPYNRVLSVQIVADVSGQRLEKVIYLKSRSPRSRPKLRRVVLNILRELKARGLISEWPSQIIIFGHFLRADLPNFSDFWSAKREFDGYGRTFTGSGNIEPAQDDDQPQSSSPFALIVGRRPNRRLIRVRYIDTMLLTPGRGSLDTAAGLIDAAKVNLPPGFTKDRMDLLLRSDPVAYEHYALHDARLALDYGLHMMWFAQTELGLNALPSTLAGMAIASLKAHFKQQGRDLVGELGLERKSEKRYSRRTQQYFTRNWIAARFERQVFEEFAALGYHGGRNECFYCGPTDVGAYYDFDLSGAYTTAMCALRPLDYAKAQLSTSLDAFGIDAHGPGQHCLDIAGVARVEFEFPHGTKFPCLPVRSGDRLLFPRTGVSTCTAHELLLAHRLGAALKIQMGLVIPWKDAPPIFMDFIRKVQAKRASAPAKSLLNQIWKELGNSLYGKTAQGVHERRVFNPKTGGSNPVPHSEVTTPWFAAYVTGFIRAVLGELIAGVPSDRLIVSATTDGFLTDAGLDEIPVDGPLALEFRRLRHLAFGDDVILVEKHRVAQVVAMKTRGQMTGEIIPGHDVLLAKAGVKPLAEPEDHNGYMLHLYLNRQFDQKHLRRSLVSMRHMWHTESDLVAYEQDIRLNLEYDFKRRPVKPTMGIVRGYEHLAFQTAPWDTAADAEIASVRFRGWSQRACRLLKNLNDYSSFSSYLMQSRVTRGLGMQVRADASLGVLKRLFLRAFTRETWGLKKEGWTYKELAEYLSQAGFSTTTTDIKNAARKEAKLEEHLVVVDDHSVPLIRHILREFPDFDLEKAVRPEDLADLLAALGR